MSEKTCIWDYDETLQKYKAGNEMLDVLGRVTNEIKSCEKDI